MGRLDAVDLSVTMSRDNSEKRLVELQRRLLHLQLFCAGLLDEPRLGPPLLVVFEGWDASGKGGSIKRLVARLDPRHAKVTGFSAPTDEESRHHFLWRFWPHVPSSGEMSVFDRSWYGRVLVERVEKLISKKLWQDAFEEIVSFERSLVLEGAVVVKFWLHISEQEQLKRFESRASDPLRQWKLTEDDWRNRSRHDDYEKALNEVFERTDHEFAPWDVIAAENKHWARVKVVETVISRLEAGMRCAGFEVPPSLGADYDRSS